MTLPSPLFTKVMGGSTCHFSFSNQPCSYEILRPRVLSVCPADLKPWGLACLASDTHSQGYEKLTCGGELVSNLLHGMNLPIKQYIYYSKSSA